MAISKPNLTRIWAATAAGGDVVDPDVQTPGKFSLGWSAEKPPYQFFNFIQQFLTKGLGYIDEQGIGFWNTDTDYQDLSITKGSNGVIYLLKVNGDGTVDPVGDGGTNWTQLPTRAEVDAKANQSTTYTKTDTNALIASLSHEVGEVILFAGTSAALNTKYGQGWRIADGTDGTPDLIDSFPKMGTFAQRTGSGGAKTIRPSGSVGVSTSVSVYNHTLSIAEMPSHTHNIKLGYSPGGDNSPEETDRDWSGNSSTDAAGGSQGHSHGASASSSGSFSGSSHTNEPQFTYLVPLYFTGVAGTYT